MGLQPKDLTEQRNDSLREGVKGLLVINGGGATAMLAFLQATWGTKPLLAKYIVISIVVFAIGVGVAALVHLFRYEASFAFQGGRTRMFLVYRRLYLAAAYASLLAFALGVAALAWGAWRVGL